MTDYFKFYITVQVGSIGLSPMGQLTSLAHLALSL
jgi:hypothetical protein